MTTANIVGVDPHRKTFTATMLDSRGGEVDHAHFTNNREGHAAVLVWATEHGTGRSMGRRRRQRTGPATRGVPRRRRRRRP